MKNYLAFFFVLLFVSTSSAQNNPNCSHLTVDKLEMDNDTANLVKVTLGNSCSNCSSGLNGCVYLELKVIRTVAPFDTLAESKCFCKLSPDNNAQKIYGISSKVSSLPPINTLRVSFLAGVCGCDTIPFKSATNLVAQSAPQPYSVYPNPAKTVLVIRNPQGKQTRIKIHDAIGRIMYDSEISAKSETIDVAGYCGGIYFVSIYDIENQSKEIFRLAKE